MRKLTTLLMFAFTFLFSYTITAQQMRAFRDSYNFNFPKKIMKPMGDPLPAGTYTIGTSGDFPTIDSAFNKLSTDGISGSVTLELTDTLYTAPYTKPEDSLGFFLNGPIPGADQNNRVTIKPAADKNVIIEGSGFAVLTCLNTSYVTFDGVALSGSTSLTIHALHNNQFICNDCLDFLKNSDHNLIQNATFISEDYNRANGIGLLADQNGGISTPDSNLIQNNFLKSAEIGIFISAYPSSSMNEGNIVRSNYVGSDVDSLIAWGIQLQHCHNTIVENNIIQNIKVTSSNASNVDLGINSYWGSGDTIRNNVVHNIKNKAGETSAGIALSGVIGNIGSNNLVYNNMIYDIQSTSTASNSRVTGIQMFNQNDPKVYYNSIYLTGQGSSPAGSAALYIYSNCSNVEAKNNILVNTRDESHYYASSIFDYTTSNLVSDNNDLYYESHQYNCLINIGGIKYNTLSDWQVKGKDLLSITEIPNFKAPYLHIDESIPTNLEKRGAVIAGIDADFDGDTRDASLPDIGADEFNGQIVSGPLMSGYSVGTNGYFPTIDSAFKRLSNDGVSGPVTLELIDTLYTAPSDSSGFFLNGPIIGADTNNRVTIRPATDKNVTIEGSGASAISLLNTSYLTLDGEALTGNTTLTIHTLYSSQYNLVNGGSITFIDNSNHNVVQNITAINENSRSFGIGLVIEDPHSLYSPDSNLIQNNFLKEAGLGIHISGYTTNLVAVKKPADNIIRGNLIGSGTEAQVVWGIQIQYCTNTIIENNEISNVSNLNSNLVSVAIGIDSYNSIETIIRNNIIHNFLANSNETDAVGIMLDGGGNNNLLYNNMVYDIADSSKGTSCRVAGIDLWDQTNPQIYYNSVYLAGKGSSPSGSAALYIHSNCSNVKAENNILVNTRDESPYYASSINDYTTSDLVSNNNDLYYGEDQYNCLAKIGSTEYTTLANWQSKGEGLNSITEMPSFKAPDLHIDESIPTNLESHGIPITGIDVDIDGDVRGTDSTDIGADEFNGETIVGIKDKVTQPIVYNLKQNYPNPFNPSTTIKYSIPKQSYVTVKVYDILGREVATLVNEEKPAGNYNVRINVGQDSSPDIASGVYFYQLIAGNYVSTKKMILLK